jgi:PHO85 cyclin-6/7
VVVSPAVSDQVYHPYHTTMMGGTVDRATKSSASSTRHRHDNSSRSTLQPSELVQTSSRITTSTPLSGSTAASGNILPSYLSQGLPAYVYPPSQTSPSSSDSTPGGTAPTSHPASSAAWQPSQGYLIAQELQLSRPIGSSPSSPRLQPTHPSTQSLGGSAVTSPSRIKVRDLSHIQSFASEEFLEQSQRSRRPGRGRPREVGRQYEISSMPVGDIIEMVAGLLTKITTTNDLQHEHLHRHIPPPEGTSSLSPSASSVLAFHGKNIPSITILSYLTRIHKYCPTTYEVFLSLLVYFDRMTEMVNNQSIQQLRRRADPSTLKSESHSRASSVSQPIPAGHPFVVTPPSSSGITAQDHKSPEPSIPVPLQLDEEDEQNLSNFFVVDSFNIHRLVIAGVTCASKFFSDVFYTNSRYAKVCP